MDLEKTITLRKPVTLGDLPFASISLREPTAGELEQAENSASGLSTVINLISIVGKVPRTVAERLCQRDFKEAADFLNSFDDADQTTGSTSSQS